MVSLKASIIVNVIMTQKKEISTPWASDCWTHTLVIELELKIQRAVLKEERDKSVKLLNCPHEANSKSHSIWEVPHPGHVLCRGI